MKQEQVTPENSTAQPAPAKPEGEALLPDGIGLSLEQAQALIVKSNGIVLANDEPALMGITICNAYLAEVVKLHARHEKGLTRLMAEKTDAYVSGEISEQTVHLARESGVAYLACGHHATERYGVEALGAHLAARFGLACEFVDIANPV